MAAGDSILTYDDLTSIYRVEKGTTALSSVRKDLYPAMLALYERQAKECDRLASSDVDSLMFDGASDRKKKIFNLMKDVTQARMDKILNLALRGAMGANNVLDTLTREEREYYEEVLNASKKHWALLDRKKRTVMDITQPGVEVEPAKEEITVVGTTVENVVPEYSDAPPTEIPERVSTSETQAPIVEIEEFPEDPEEMTEDIITEKELDDMPVNPPVPVKEQVKTADGTLIIRILENLEPFAGLNDIVYKLRKEDIVRMPAMFALALVNRGKASIVDVTL